MESDERRAGFYKREVFFSDSFPFSITHAIHTPGQVNASKYFQREFWKVAYILKGCGEKIINGNRYPIHPGSIMLVHPNAKTTIAIKSKTMELFNLVFMPEILSVDIRQLKTDFDFFSIFSPDEPLNQGLYIFDSDRKLKSLVDEIENESNRRPPNYQTMIRVLLTNLLLLMARKGAREFKRHSDTNIAAYVDHIIDTCLHENFNLDMLSKRIGIGKSRLCLVYRRTKGATIMDALRTRRLHEAKDLLSKSSLGIPEICYKVGFSDLSYFYRRFVREFGVTPKKFRRQPT